MINKNNHNQRPLINRKLSTLFFIIIASLPQIKSKSTKNEIYNRDPGEHIEGTTFLEVTNLFQGYFINEIDLHNQHRCNGDCENYEDLESKSCESTETMKVCKAQQKTFNGRFRYCKFIHSDLTICPSDQNPNRKFEFVKFGNGKLYGKKQSCKTRQTTAGSWLSFFGRCDYCFCVYETKPNDDSDRHFNLRPRISNVIKNMVVTGLKFSKNNRIIHLQIQEGKLLAKGKIDPKSVRWVPVEDYRITDKGFFYFKDFHEFSYKNKSIDLDDLEAGEGHVVTGIGFEIIDSHLNFKIQSTPFDFVSGNLIEPLKSSKWINNRKPKNKRSRILLLNPDRSTLAFEENDKFSESNSFIDLRETDSYADASQSTVPFFDAQPVEAGIPAPLSGAGIYHRRRCGYGGFIAPKIFTLD